MHYAPYRRVRMLTLTEFMTEKEKMLAGEIYDANYDPELLAERRRCKTLLHKFNSLLPEAVEEGEALLRQIIGKTPEHFVIEAPIHIDYGFNVEIGERAYMNVGCTILDEAKVTIGENCFIGPNCSFYTACHPLDAERRNKGLEWAKPITLGKNVWFGGNVTVVPGVTVGDNAVVGAGSVVTKDVPANVVVAGNPAKVIRHL